MTVSDPFNLPTATQKKIFNSMDEDELSEFLDLINQLEAFSTYFVSRVAHSETAYKTLGVAYCLLVEYCSPILTFERDSQNSYLNIKELYPHWKNKLKSEKTKEEYLLTLNPDNEHFSSIGT